ncbi:MAG: alpha/beta hydrolase [Solirubrobacteraceae bacterium MAG38_C4-C5]|nr:alpha/beta hydrolase [Candidatus Siliceabacter maunaloa]
MNAAVKAALVAVPLAGVAWERQRRADRRAIEADPLKAVLDTPLEGRGQEVVEVVAPDGTPLHAEVFGPADAPTVVLVHGWTCTLETWTHQIQALDGDLRLVAFDLRGHGRSGRPPGGDWSIEALAGDLDAVLRACVPDGERAVLAGHSLGAMTTVAWADQHPDEVRERVAGASLISTGLGDLITESLLVGTPGPLQLVKGTVGRAFLGARAPLPSATTPLSNRVIRYIACSPNASPATVAFCEKMILSCHRAARGGCGATVSDLELREALKDLAVPTAVLVGERDRLTPPVHARAMADVLPDVTAYVELPGIGHMTPLEAPAEVTASIRALTARAVAHARAA